MRIENDGDEFGAAAGQKFHVVEPIEALNKFDRMYRRLMNANDHGPAKVSARYKAILTQAEAQNVKIQALEASITQLKQDHNASSAGGSGGGGSGGGCSNVVCFRCGGTGHKKNDPECPEHGKPTHGLSEELSRQTGKLA